MIQCLRVAFRKKLKRCFLRCVSKSRSRVSYLLGVFNVRNARSCDLFGRLSPMIAVLGSARFVERYRSGAPQSLFSGRNAICSIKNNNRLNDGKLIVYDIGAGSFAHQSGDLPVE